jgi:hypothetical protein
MARSAAGAGRRSRGRTETLPSGSLRVQVYAGVDPITKKRHHLTETVPAGARATAEKVRTRLLKQVQARCPMEVARDEPAGGVRGASDHPPGSDAANGRAGRPDLGRRVEGHELGSSGPARDGRLRAAG